jgi:hypothetical protein
LTATYANLAEANQKEENTMKTLIISAALILSGAYAGSFNSPFEVGNPDLYAGVEDSRQLPAAVQPGIGDAYDPG